MVWYTYGRMLKLTKKADYGLIALRHLTVLGSVVPARSDSSTAPLHAAPVSARPTASAKDIADAYSIPQPLLSKILQKLTKGGLLISEQGTNGGYRLSRDPREITALEVIRTIDGPIILTKCFTDHPGCDQSACCPVREPLRKVHEGILGLLKGISLLDLASDDMQVPNPPKPGSLSGIRTSIQPGLANIQLTSNSADPTGLTR